MAQELVYGQKDDELYAGTPSLSTLKLLLSWYCTMWKADDVVKIIDIKCAFLYGKARRALFIELPEQDAKSGGRLVGRLKKAMYGTRDAPLIWRATVDAFMRKAGFLIATLQPGVYYHVTRGLRVMTHVDDFLLTGNVKHAEWFEAELKKEYDITVTTLGENFEKKGKYLNREITWTKEGIQIEGDQKHVQILLDESGMTECKGIATPVAKDEGDSVLHHDQVLNAKSATQFRRAAARINYMSQDRPDISTASRLLSQGMKEPKASDELKLKRVMRYLKDHPRCISLMKWQDENSELRLLVDSDWAGDKASRKSCSGGCIMLGSHLICHWSKMQGTIALSSGEAELNAAVKGMSEGIGVLELSAEIGMNLKMSISTDASVCKSILLRHGSGRIKHLSTKQLWIQGALESYGVKVLKIPRSINNADLMTHGCNAEDFHDHLDRLRQDLKKQIPPRMS